MINEITTYYLPLAFSFFLHFCCLGGMLIGLIFGTAFFGRLIDSREEREEREDIIVFFLVAVFSLVVSWIAYLVLKSTGL